MKPLFLFLSAVLVIFFSASLTQAVNVPTKANASQRLKTIIVNNYHPYTFMNDKGEPDGFSVEIARAATKAMDLELEIRADKWDVAMKELEAGSIDLLPMMANSPERNKIFDFSVPHTIAYDAIFLRKGNTTLRTLKDLSGKTVIVMNKDITHSYLLSSGLSNTMTLNLVDSLPEALKQLSAGKGDAAIMPKLVGIVTAKKLDLSNIETSPQLIDSYTRPFSFAVKNGNQELLERLNQGLNIIKSSGEYDIIYKKWFGALEGSRLNLKTIIKFGSVAALILFGFIVWNVVLKRQVRVKTEHLEAEIIQRKQAEETLKESTDKFISLADNVPGYVAYVNAQTMQYEYVNDAFEKSFGIPRNKIIGSHIKELLGETNYQFALPYIDKVKSGEPASYENAFDLDLGKRWIQVNYNPVFNANGQVVSIVVLSYDITERRQAEEMIVQAKNDWESTFDAVTDMITIQDSDFNIIRANLAAKTILELPSLIPAKCFKYYHGVEQPLTGCPSCESLTTGACCTVEMFEPHLGKHLEIRAMPRLGNDGRVVALIHVIRDITKQKQAEDEKNKLEAQLQQAQKIESIGRLAGGVAHDFNNLLTVIIGYSQIGLMESDPESPITAYLEQIRKTADRAADLTRQLLAFARKQTIAPKVLDLNETVSGMLKMLQRLMGEDISLAWHPASGLWQIKADPSQIDQILANLCVNARDAIKGTGHVTIRTRNNTIDADFCKKFPDSLPGEYVHLSVSDDGSGMDKETMYHVFEPFFTTKGIGEGTGLGLATVYGIVKQNNGFITIQSTPGQGTTFSIHLPRIEDSTSTLLIVEAPTCLQRGQETILLVEDDSAILKIAAMMLEKQGYRVHSAMSPREAITIAGELKGVINLLITDVILPEMNGRDLATGLLTLYPQIRCLYMSGYTADVIGQHGVLDDGEHFIHKPFSLPGFAAKVREVLDGKN